MQSVSIGSRPLAHAAAILFSAGAFAASSGEAHAAAARFVATTGSDANTCTHALPCRSLQRAHDMVPIDGQIQILDSGLFTDPLTITKAVTIVADGVSATLGEMLVDTTGVVALRGLRLNGALATGSTKGIEVLAGGRLVIENCVIERFPGAGILHRGDGELAISGSVVEANSDQGLAVFPSPLGTLVTIADSAFTGNSNGIQLDSVTAAITHVTLTRNEALGLVLYSSKATVSHTIANGNAAGFGMNDGSEMVLTFSESRENSSFGVTISPGTTAYLAHNVITFNDAGVVNQGSAFSGGFNTIELNNFDTTLIPIVVYAPE